MTVILHYDLLLPFLKVKDEILHFYNHQKLTRQSPKNVETAKEIVIQKVQSLKLLKKVKLKLMI